MKGWHSLGVTDQYGRRAVVTGANTGLGYQTALALAGAGAEVVMAVRDLDRGQDAAQRIRDASTSRSCASCTWIWPTSRRSATSPRSRPRPARSTCWSTTPG